MATGIIDAGSDFYDLFIDNIDSENKLGDNEFSSASNFTVDIEPQLDLTSLLYLRSIQAEIAVKNLMIDNLPLTYVHSESITAKLETMPENAVVNQRWNFIEATKLNDVTLTLPMSNYTCTEAGSAVSFLNSLLSHRVNNYILYKFLTLFLDVNVFEPDYMSHRLTSADIKLLQYYINITLLCRKEIHVFLCNLVDITDEIDSCNLSDIKNNFTEDFETKTLAESDCLRAKAQRDITLNKINEFAMFYSVNLKTENSALTTKLGLVRTAIKTWLRNLEFLDEQFQLKKNVNDEIEEYIESNKKLIELGNISRNILNVQKEPKTNNLFHGDFLTLVYDQCATKCVFDFNPSLYLSSDNSVITITFPKRVSYILGSSNDEQIVIGPLTGEPVTIPTPRIANNIVSTFQRLPFNVSPLPKLMFIACDVSMSKRRDSWLKNTPYEDYHLIHTQILDSDMISNKFVHKTDDQLIFFRMQRINNILDRFNIKILDHNFKQCLFSQKCTCRISFCIKPVAIENTVSF